MTPASMRAAAPVRVFQLLREALSRHAAPPAAPELPGHEQLREAREHRRYIAASPHILAVGGRIDVALLPR